MFSPSKVKALGILSQGMVEIAQCMQEENRRLWDKGGYKELECIPVGKATVELALVAMLEKTMVLTSVMIDTYLMVSGSLDGEGKEGKS